MATAIREHGAFLKSARRSAGKSIKPRLNRD
jgi:hypothetical protein